MFDHMPKTAGSAVNAWLRSELGSGSVTPNRQGSQANLISSYGGNFAVISAHLSFDKASLDPRYQFVTCFREPIDRATSWLYFVISHDSEDLPGLHEAVTEFVNDPQGWQLNSDAYLGDLEKLEFRRQLIKEISNSYVEHFLGIDPNQDRTDDEKIAFAIQQLDLYEVWGLYEKLPEFLEDFGGLLGVPAPDRLNKVNVTRTRPEVTQITPALRSRLEAMNALDLKFYEMLSDRYAGCRQRWRRPLPVSGWLPYRHPPQLDYCSPEFALSSFHLNERDGMRAGRKIALEIEFSLSSFLRELVVAVTIIDAQDQVSAYFDSRRIGNAALSPSTGTYRLALAKAIDLPDGKYSISLSFMEQSGKRVFQTLASFHHMADFSVERDPRRATTEAAKSGVLTLTRVHQNVSKLVSDGRGHMRGDSPSKVGPDQLFSLPVEVLNETAEDWTSLWQRELRLSYRWLDAKGTVVVLSGIRTHIDASRISAGHALVTSMTVQAPSALGKYKLVAMPVQEGFCWLDQQGFRPLELVVEVVPLDSAPALSSQLFRLESPDCGGWVNATWRESEAPEINLLLAPASRAGRGKWQASLNGQFSPGDKPVLAEVVVEDDGRVLASKTLTASCEQIAFDYQVDAPAKAIGIRFWVDAKACVEVASLVTRAVANS